MGLGGRLGNFSLSTSGKYHTVVFCFPAALLTISLFRKQIGFVLLLSGTFVYNGVLIVPLMRKVGILKRKLPRERQLTPKTDEVAPLLN